MDDKLVESYLSFLEKMQEHFKDEHGRPYTDQDLDSMLGLAGCVLLQRPKWILEVGTGHGGSTYAMLKAIEYAIPPLGDVLFQTVDRNKTGWDHLNALMGDMSDRVQFHSDLSSLTKPLGIGPGLIFWDAHDDQEWFSEEALKIILKWIGKKMVIVHDCYITDRAVKPKMPDARLRVTMAAHDGTIWTGRAELMNFLNYCKVVKLPVYCTSAGLMFFA